MRYFFIVVLILSPCVVNGAVIINEVAWMGDADSANNEWIELYNTGASAVVVDGWVLSDGMNLSIDLVGTIDAKEYAVIERTDDDSAPGSAFMIYTGSLTNSGATLTLNDDSEIVDQVAGGENWQSIGGDNVTKETAQYTESGWITAAATPGSQAVFSGIDEEDTEDEESEDDSENTNSDTDQEITIKSNGGSTEKLEVSDDLEVTFLVPKYVYVNQPITIKAQPSGEGDVVLDSLSYTWNFGDLNTDSGQEVIHAYTAAGSYSLALTAAYASYEEQARSVITVLPVPVSLARHGDIIHVHNDAAYEVDLSGYTLYGTKALVFPASSYLLPNATLQIPVSEVRAVANISVKLFDARNNLVAILPAVVSNTSIMQTPEVEPAPVVTYTQNTKPVSALTTNPTTTVVEKTVDNNASPTKTIISAPTKTESNKNPRLWYLGLVGLLGAGAFTIFSTRST